MVLMLKTFFPSKHDALAGGAPAVFPRDTCFADNAMTRNQVGQGISSHGGPYRACGVGLLQRAGQTSVADHSARLDLDQSSPYAHLKGSAANKGAQRVTAR